NREVVERNLYVGASANTCLAGEFADLGRAIGAGDQQAGYFMGFAHGPVDGRRSNRSLLL
ncbi:MAG: hypothetical protein ABGY42_13890, partial [bacterium]